MASRFVSECRLLCFGEGVPVEVHGADDPLEEIFRTVHAEGEHFTALVKDHPGSGGFIAVDEAVLANEVKHLIERVGRR